MDYRLKCVSPSGRADSDAAEAAAYELAERHRLTYADLTAEEPDERVRAVFGAAEDAAWPGAPTGAECLRWSYGYDPIQHGYLEVHPL